MYYIEKLLGIVKTSRHTIQESFSTTNLNERTFKVMSIIRKIISIYRRYMHNSSQSNSYLFADQIQDKIVIILIMNLDIFEH